MQKFDVSGPEKSNPHNQAEHGNYATKLSPQYHIYGWILMPMLSRKKFECELAAKTVLVWDCSICKEKKYDENEI